MHWPYGMPDPQPNAQPRDALLQQLEQVLRGADPILSQMASWSSALRIDPRLSMAPGAEPLYRTLAEIILARYGLKGTVRRAITDEDPRSVGDALVLDSMTLGRMANQARGLLYLLMMAATQAQRPAIEQIDRALLAERANYREAEPIIRRILGPDADAVQGRVLQQLVALPVHVLPPGESPSAGG